MNLFQLGDFTLASGEKSNFKIECDVFSADDWEALAAMAVELLPPFGEVYGVPRGGIPFADALRPYGRACSVSFAHQPHDQCLGKPLPFLIAEDVVTSGKSIQRYLETLPWWSSSKVLGVCVFARGECPGWVTPLFQMPIKKG